MVFLLAEIMLSLFNNVYLFVCNNPPAMTHVETQLVGIAEQKQILLLPVKHPERVLLE